MENEDSDDGKIVPVMHICIKCPNFYGEDLQRYHDNGRCYEGDFWWECKYASAAMFVGDPRHWVEKNGYVQKTEDSVPKECPYTLEHLYCQKEYANERWKDMRPLLKKWLLASVKPGL
jgi:hypothetical protein